MALRSFGTAKSYLILPMLESSGVTEAVVLIKAAPHASQKHGETVCCAVIDLEGNWLRLYPVSFRHLDDAQKFGRWDIVQFKWSRPKDDLRTESRRVDQQSLSIIGKMPKRERQDFLGSLIVTSLVKEREAGRSLALLQCEILEFFHEKKNAGELAKEAEKFKALRNQADFFNHKRLIPFSPTPYKFKYRYNTDDGIRIGTCQDWETETTFYNWSKLYGEEEALDRMSENFGEKFPKKGMLLAMGTHSLRQVQWLINGVIRLDEIKQLNLF